MDNIGAVPLRLDLDGAALGAANSNTSASPSPAVLSASVVTAASSYPMAPSSASSMQMLSSDEPLGRESKRPRIIGRHANAISRNPADMGDRSGHQGMDQAHERLDVNYSQDLEISSQSSSTMAVVTPSTIPSETYPVVGTPYWSSNSLGAGPMDKTNPENGDTNHNLGGGEGQMQPQIYGNGVAWGQDISMPMSAMQQYVPRRMAEGPWESELRQSQQSHQQMQHDGSLASPYESPSATRNNPQIYGDYPMVNGPAHRIAPSNAYGTPNGNSAPTTPRLAPSPAAGWPQTAFHGPGAGAGGANMRRGSSRLGSTGLSKEIRPKILTSSASSGLLPRRSPVQQHSAAGTGSTKSERAKSGDRTTHNDVERKYRTNLKDRIAELRAAVPALQGQQQQHDGESDGTSGHAASAPKVSKGTVLSKATEYIQQLEQANRAMANEHRQLMERLHTLEAMLQNDGGGARTPQYTSNHGMSMFDPRGFS